MSVTTTVAMAVVRRWLTRAPITLRLRQWISSGIRAKGMPKESTTWLMRGHRMKTGESYGSESGPVSITHRRDR